VLSRIEALEAAYGGLVERRRGGEGGGGSRVTATGRDLLGRYDRLQAVLTAAAAVPETVFDGTVTAVDGELALVDTPVGEITGLHGGDDEAAESDEVTVGGAVQVRIGADAVTVNDATDLVAPDATSARNQLAGRITGIDAGETVSTARITVETDVSHGSEPDGFTRLRGSRNRRRGRRAGHPGEHRAARPRARRPGIDPVEGDRDAVGPADGVTPAPRGRVDRSPRGNRSRASERFLRRPTGGDV